MDGRKIKSINRYWNKRKAKLQSIATRQGFHMTEQIYNLTRKRNNRIDNYIKKTVRYIINHCIANDIGTVVCGYQMCRKAPCFSTGNIRHVRRICVSN